MKTFCKICFEPIDILNKKTSLCSSCFNKLEVRFKRIKIDQTPVRIIYNYNDFFKTLLYSFKGCYDYELKNIFLERFVFELRLRYYKYLIIPVPSTIEDDNNRGFNHVEEIFSLLQLPIKKVIYKNKNFKQSSRNKEERKQVKNDFSIKENSFIKNQKILLVDDVITTGNSIKTCIELIKKYHPRKIEVLILSKKDE